MQSKFSFRNMTLDFSIPSELNFIKDRRILDIASHTGESSAGLKLLGAKTVLGIEPRVESVNIAKALIIENDIKFVDFIVADATDFSLLQELLRDIDTVTNFGMFYHITDHHMFLKTICESTVQNLILETEFGPECPTPGIDWCVESTDWELAGYNGKESILVGSPNLPWIKTILSLYGWQIVLYKAFYLKDIGSSQRFVIGAINTKFVDGSNLKKIPDDMYEWRIAPNTLVGKEFNAYEI